MVDYNALANKFNGTAVATPTTPKGGVDYNVLATKFGGNVTTTLPSQTQKPGIGTFIKNEVTGTPQETGFFGGIVHSLLSPVRVVQNLAKAVAQPAIGDTLNKLSDAQQNLATATLHAIETKKTLTEPKRIDFYNKLISDNTKQLADMGVASSDLSKLGLTQKENLGTALEAGSTLATFLISPAGAGVKGILAASAKVGTAGAVTGAGQALQKNATIQDTLKQAFVTGVASAVTFGLATGAGRVISTIAKEVPVKLVQSIGKLERNEAQAILDKGWWGKLGNIKAQVDTEGERLNSQIASKIEQQPGVIDSADFLGKVMGKIKQKYNGVADDKIIEVLNSANIDPFLNEDKVSFKVADNIRKSLFKDVPYGARTSFIQDIKNILWKEIVNTYRPVTNTTKEFAQYAPLVEASKKITNLIAKNGNKIGLNTADWIMGGVEFLGHANPLLSATSLITKKTLGTATAKTGIAVGLNNVNQIMSKIPTSAFDSAGMISKTALIKILSQITNQE